MTQMSGSAINWLPSNLEGAVMRILLVCRQRGADRSSTGGHPLNGMPARQATVPNSLAVSTMSRISSAYPLLGSGVDGWLRD